MTTDGSIRTVPPTRTPVPLPAAPHRHILEGASGHRPGREAARWSSRNVDGTARAARSWVGALAAVPRCWLVLARCSAGVGREPDAAVRRDRLAAQRDDRRPRSTSRSSTRARPARGPTRSTVSVRRRRTRDDPPGREATGGPASLQLVRDASRSGCIAVAFTARAKDNSDGSLSAGRSSSGRCRDRDPGADADADRRRPRRRRRPVRPPRRRRSRPPPERRPRRRGRRPDRPPPRRLRRRPDPRRRPHRPDVARRRPRRRSTAVPTPTAVPADLTDPFPTADPTDPPITAVVIGGSGSGRTRSGGSGGTDEPAGGPDSERSGGVGSARERRSRSPACSGPTFPAFGLAPTLVTTTGAVAAAMALGLFGRRRRDDDQPDDVLAAAAANGRRLVAAALDGCRDRTGGRRWRAASEPAARASTSTTWRRCCRAGAGRRCSRPARPIRSATRRPRRASPSTRASSARSPERERRVDPLPRRPPARLARRAARRGDRLPRPG